MYECVLFWSFDQISNWTTNPFYSCMVNKLSILRFDNFDATGKKVYKYLILGFSEGLLFLKKKTSRALKSYFTVKQYWTWLFSIIALDVRNSSMSSSSNTVWGRVFTIDSTKPLLLIERISVSFLLSVSAVCWRLGCVSCHITITNVCCTTALGRLHCWISCPVHSSLLISL